TVLFLSSSACSCILVFSLYCYGDHRDLHSFPTRRSSDLNQSFVKFIRDEINSGFSKEEKSPQTFAGKKIKREELELLLSKIYNRSEEHTSELQSRENLVCRLLLEKKNKQRLNRHNN